MAPVRVGGVLVRPRHPPTTIRDRPQGHPRIGARVVSERAGDVIPRGGGGQGGPHRCGKAFRDAAACPECGSQVVRLEDEAPTLHQPGLPCSDPGKDHPSPRSGAGHRGLGKSHVPSWWGRGLCAIPRTSSSSSGAVTGAGADGGQVGRQPAGCHRPRAGPPALIRLLFALASATRGADRQTPRLGLRSLADLAARLPSPGEAPGHRPRGGRQHRPVLPEPPTSRSWRTRPGGVAPRSASAPGVPPGGKSLSLPEPLTGMGGTRPRPWWRLGAHRDRLVTKGTDYLVPAMPRFQAEKARSQGVTILPRRPSQVLGEDSSCKRLTCSDRRPGAGGLV
jgi:hypothetical protein